MSGEPQRIGEAAFDVFHREPLDRDQQIRLKRGTFSVGEIVLETRRLALMNLYLHGIEADIHYGDSIAEGAGDRRYDCILTNPPFGTTGGGVSSQIGPTFHGQRVA